MPRLIPVDDPADPRLDAYRDIRERDLVGRRGRFVAEGTLVLEQLASSPRFELESALLLASRAAALADLLSLLPEDAPVYVAPPAVMDRVAGFPVHRGVLAIGRRGPEPGFEDVLGALPARGIVLCLVGIANHDNMGALFRAAAAFGVGAIILDPTCCDPLYRKAIRVSVGAALRVPFVSEATPEAMIAALDASGFAHAALSPSGPTAIGDLARAPRMALWLGAEGPGLPGALLEALPTVRIPLAPGWDSLNVATAAAVALHRLADLDGANLQAVGPGPGRA